MIASTGPGLGVEPGADVLAHRIGQGGCITQAAAAARKFFQRAAMDAETEENEQTRTVAEEGESILDVASTLYQPVRRLRWHYRSRHHSLIAFSNKEFYQGDLVIFPSAYHEHKDLGVKYHPVRDGVFENGRNARETAVVVDAVMDHMERRPDESLGVATLNFEQGELIEELLDQRLRSDPFALASSGKDDGRVGAIFRQEPRKRAGRRA